MSATKVLPIIVTAKCSKAPKDMLAAFEIAEPGEYDIIEGWAKRFGFETTEAYTIDLFDMPERETLVQ